MSLVYESWFAESTSRPRLLPAVLSFGQEGRRRELVTVNDQTAQSDKAKPLCFGIGPIGLEGSDVRKQSDMILNAIVKDVLTTAFGYNVRRANEDADPGMIPS